MRPLSFVCVFLLLLSSGGVSLHAQQNRQNNNQNEQGNRRNQNNQGNKANQNQQGNNRNQNKDGQNNPTGGAGRSILQNGSFEAVGGGQVPWYGINAKGEFSGFGAESAILTAKGNIESRAMPLSVVIHDMNADGKNDIVTSDPRGYIRIYFNEGTAEVPKFNYADIASIILSYSNRKEERHFTDRLAPKITIFERNEVPHIVAANYSGEVIMVPNSGSMEVPQFRQPNQISDNLVSTTKDNRKWGNVFAPAYWDWNGDRVRDLLLGEGSYSANNIHLAINQGSDEVPRFDEAQRHVIAFGDGREQLTPAVVDFNGDGYNDLLIAALDGKIGVHLHPPKPWEPGMELPMTSFLTAGGAKGQPIDLKGHSTVAAGDLNADGLFDLVFGKNDQTIWVSMNSGTPQEPKFDQPKQMAGGAGDFAKVSMPQGWNVDLGIGKGNILAFASVVSEAEEPELAPVDGKSVLKVGYMPNRNRIMPITTIDIDESSLIKIEQVAKDALEIGAQYKLSFHVKGSGVSLGNADIEFGTERKVGEAKIVRGERGSVRRLENTVEERVSINTPFTPGSDWREVSKTFTARFTKDELKGAKGQKVGVSLIITALLQPGSGAFYLDNVKLEKVQ